VPLETIEAVSAVEWTNLAVAMATFLLAVAAFLALRESRALGIVTREQAEATREQAEAARGALEATLAQAAATREQAELARTALARQIEPFLLPTGEEGFSVGEVENVAGEVQPINVLPVYVGVFNAGNGVAVIDEVEASGPHGRAGVFVPPTVAAGAERRIRLAFTFGDRARAGDKFSALIRYHGVDHVPRTLAFEATWYPHGHWRIENVQT
jgi:hypothetical protein